MLPSRDSATRPPDWEAALLSIRQARDNALARASELADRIRHLEEQLARTQDQVTDAQEAYAEATRRESGIRRERDDLQIKLLEMNGQKLASLENEWRSSTALSEARRELSIITNERDSLRRQLESATVPPESFVSDLKGITFQGDPAEALRTEVENLRARLEEREAVMDAQRRRFEEEHAVLEAQLLAVRGSIPREDVEEYADCGAAADVSRSLPDVVDEAVVMVSELTGNESDAECLDALRELLSLVEQHATQNARPTLHRVTRATLEMVLWLRNSPGKIAQNLTELTAGVTMIKDLLPAEPDIALNGAIYAVDDDIDNCECIAMALQKFQLSANYSAKPERALSQLQKEPYDLILLDFDMPGMNGMELLDELRRSETNQRTPVLFVSGLESARALVSNLHDPSIEFISKPYNLTTLALRALMLMLRARAA
jgi:CheY-like chemotaxis protein